MGANGLGAVAEGSEQLQECVAQFGQRLARQLVKVVGDFALEGGCSEQLGLCGGIRRLQDQESGTPGFGLRSVLVGVGESGRWTEACVYRFLKLTEELVCFCFLSAVDVGLHGLKGGQDWRKGLGAVGGHGGMCFGRDGCAEGQ